MKVLDDIWDSIRGNVKTRITDPIIGVFVLSWSLSNWDRLAILFFGNSKLEVRIKELSSDMAFIEHPELIWQNYDLLILPSILTVLYIFALPRASGWVTLLINPTELERHNQLIDLDTQKSIKQKNLNKTRLRADPKNRFLEQEIEMDLAKEKSNAERIERENLAAKEKTEEAIILKERAVQEKNAATASAEEAKSKAESAKLEWQKKERKDTLEKMKLTESTAEHKATMASHRFPSVFLFLSDVSESISLDGVVMSMDGLSRCVAAIFGYDDFNKLLNDKDFNNEVLNKLKYVICEPDYLTKKFTEILDDENINNYDSKWLIEHVESVFENLSYEFIYEDSLAEKVYEQVSENSYDLLEEATINSVVAITDTSFEEVFVEPTGSYGIDTADGAFFVKLTGNASGVHRKESGVSGQGIVFDLNVKFPVILGKFGFSEYEIYVTDANVEY